MVAAYRETLDAVGPPRGDPGGGDHRAVQIEEFLQALGGRLQPGVYYANCTEVEQAGAAPILRSDPATARIWTVTAAGWTAKSL